MIPNKLAIADHVQKKISGKILKKIDSKTWVYCDKDELPIDPRSKKEVVEANESKRAKRVICDGVVYSSVREYCTVNKKPFGSVYKILRGESVNTTGIKYTF